MRTAADAMGLAAYLSVMYGGLVDPGLLLAVYTGSSEGRNERKDPRLQLVEPPAKSARPATDDSRQAVA
jgi:hypothetical protein